MSLTLQPWRFNSKHNKHQDIDNQMIQQDNNNNIKKCKIQDIDNQMIQQDNNSNIKKWSKTLYWVLGFG
jgi:hypothetical protein